nr:MAG TPA: hypothetical protein [Caudoviricetes sp.]
MGLPTFLKLLHLKQHLSVHSKLIYSLSSKEGGYIAQEHKPIILYVTTYPIFSKGRLYNIRDFDYLILDIYC